MVELLFNISPGFPHFAIPTKTDGVGRALKLGKLSTVIHGENALCGHRKHQKNLCPTYPPLLPMFPPGYPRNFPQAKTAVEKPVENRWIIT